MREFSADLSAAGGGHFALVAADFTRDLSAQLVAGAERELLAHGVAAERIDCVWVPGAFEIPLACRRLVAARDRPAGGEPSEPSKSSKPSKSKYAAVIALGAVIRGQTPHFDYVAGECARGVMQVGLDTGVPVIFGVLTTDSRAQAEQRADPARADKGGAAARAALAMAALPAPPV
ncbi:MAG: 6,7-dimethyl-8-ribityllumazine synthase [Gammaproteobacteria bacterium]|nr:6,7-dimethyl-8-ribityllumazine synthase [Gammaproteobacteria bacterium]